MGLSLHFLKKIYIRSTSASIFFNIHGYLGIEYSFHLTLSTACFKGYRNSNTLSRFFSHSPRCLSPKMRFQCPRCYNTTWWCRLRFLAATWMKQNTTFQQCHVYSNPNHHLGRPFKSQKFLQGGWSWPQPTWESLGKPSIRLRRSGEIVFCSFFQSQLELLKVLVSLANISLTLWSQDYEWNSSCHAQQDGRAGFYSSFSCYAFSSYVEAA